MVETKILLSTIEKVKRFAELAWRIDGELTIKSDDGKYTVDGKSIMGIFSLNLSKPLTLLTDESTDISTLSEFFVEEN